MDEEEDAMACLPLHLLAKILALLPLPSLAQLRLVCRSWNSLLSDPASFTSRALQPECWFVMAASSSPRFIAFSPSFGPWTAFRLPLDPSSTPLISSVLGDLPPLCTPLRIAFSQSIVPSVVNMLVSSAGGLISAVVKNGGQLPPRIGFVANYDRKHGDDADPVVDYDVVVFNFLTDTIRRLPRPFRLSQRLVSSCSISMSVDPATNTYRVILSDPKYRDLEVYDSKRHRWSKGLGVRSAGGTRNIGMHDLLGGDLIRYHKDELEAYNAGSDEWSRVEAPLPRCPPLEFLRETVIKSRGRLLLVACLMEHAVAIMRGFGVWELRCSRGGEFSWVEVARTPAETILRTFQRTQFGSPSFYDCRFTGHDDLLCMTGAHYTIGNRREAQYWPPLVYDVPRDVWHHLPPYKNAMDFLCVFPLQPTFDATV